MKDSTIIAQFEKIEGDAVFLYQSSLATSKRMQALENLLSRRFSLIILLIMSIFAPSAIREYIVEEENNIKEGSNAQG